MCLQSCRYCLGSASTSGHLAFIAIVASHPDRPLMSWWYLDMINPAPTSCPPPQPLPRQHRRQSLCLGHHVFPQHWCYQLGFIHCRAWKEMVRFHTLRPQSARLLASVIHQHHINWWLWVCPLSTCEVDQERGRRWCSWCVLNHRWLLQAIKNKYASGKLLKISTIPQLNSKAVQELASPLMGRS